MNLLKHFRAIIAVVLLMTGTASVLALDVRGKVSDSDGEILPQATMRLLSAKDSTFIKGVKANNNGVYVFSGVKVAGILSRHHT